MAGTIPDVHLHMHLLSTSQSNLNTCIGQVYISLCSVEYPMRGKERNRGERQTDRGRDTEIETQRQRQRNREVEVSYHYQCSAEQESNVHFFSEHSNFIHNICLQE